MAASAGELRPYKIRNLPPSTSSADFFRAAHSSSYRLTGDANPNSCVQFISCVVSVD